MLDMVTAVQGFFKPFATLVDNLHTSDEEIGEIRNKTALIKNAFKKLENDVISQVIELQSEILKSKTAIITTEAKSEFWLTSNWRPLIMVLFGMVVFNSLILLPSLSLILNRTINFKSSMDNIPAPMWGLLKIGIGGYVGGRSLEKIAGNAATIVKNFTSKR